MSRSSCLRRMQSAAMYRSATVVFAALTACEGTIVEPNTTKAIETFEVSSATAPADGATQVRLTATVAKDVALNARGITLATTLGSFGAQASVAAEPDSSRVAIALLTAPTLPGKAFVTAKLASTIVRREVTFERAFAESVEIGSDAVSAAGGFSSRVALMVTLRRTTGRVTAGDSIALSSSAGVLTRPTRSNADGVITAAFIPGDIQPGQVTIRATAFGAGGRTLTDSLIVRVLPKS